MPNLVENPVWDEGVYKITTVDVWKGSDGVTDGLANNQGKNLANRTAWLKAKVETLDADKQPLDAMLTALAALVTSADKALYFIDADAPALTTLTAYMRTMFAATDAAAARIVMDAASPADVATAIANLVASSPAALDTLNELAAALGDDPNFAATITATLALKAPLASPALTGAPTAPTAAPGTNNTQLANTAFVVAALVAFIGQNNTWTKAQRGTVVPLTETVPGTLDTPDFSLGNNFEVTLAGNRTLANPTNLVAGQSGVITVAQDATGGRTLAFGGYWKFATGAVPSLTGTASAVDLIAYHVETATRISAVFHGDMK